MSSTPEHLHAEQFRCQTRVEVVRLARNKKAFARPDRHDQLRKGRAAAETLRTVCPDASSVRVELVFHSPLGEPHVPQMYSMFPPAKAYFVYSCPCGDCDGLFDMETVGLQMLRARRTHSAGTITCAGRRSFEGTVGRPCQMRVDYSITLSTAELRDRVG